MTDKDKRSQAQSMDSPSKTKFMIHSWLRIRTHVQHPRQVHIHLEGHYIDVTIDILFHLRHAMKCNFYTIGDNATSNAFPFPLLDQLQVAYNLRAWKYFSEGSRLYTNLQIE